MVAAECGAGLRNMGEGLVQGKVGGRRGRNHMAATHGLGRCAWQSSGPRAETEVVDESEIHSCCDCEDHDLR